MKVALIDYGMGNLGSVDRALASLGAETVFASEPAQLSGVDRMILPGVGSFADGMGRLVAQGWVDAIRAEVSGGKPLLGICLGMQLLASSGSEWGLHAGLDLIPGTVTRLDELGCQLRIPHVGWNDLRLSGSPGPLFAQIPDGSDFYFVHSFAFQTDAAADALAWVEYGVSFVVAVRRAHVFGVQFHPEKSSRAGMRVLGNFLDYRPC